MIMLKFNHAGQFEYKPADTMQLGVLRVLMRSQDNLIGRYLSDISR